MSHPHDRTTLNKTVVRRVFDVVLPDPDASAEFDDLIATDFVDHDPADPEHAHGVDSLRFTHASLHRAFPGNVRFTIDELIAERDLVAVRWSAGTAQALAWFRLRDEKITERWAIVRQVGS